MLPRKTPRCRQRRNPTRATSVPTRRIPTAHGEVRTVLTRTISVVSQSVRIWTMPRSTAAFHRSKPEASACEARSRPTIATRTAARATQTLPLTPRLRGRGGGSPEGRRRLPPPPGPRCGVTLRLGEGPAASVAMADATAADQARDTAISAPIPPSGLQAGQPSRSAQESTSTTLANGGSVRVEVDQVAAGVVEDRVHAAVVHPGRFPDEHHAFGVEAFGVALAVVGAKRDHRPAQLTAGFPERPGRLVGQAWYELDPVGLLGGDHRQPALAWAVGGAGLDLEAEHLGVEPLGRVLVVHEDPGQSDPHPPHLPR